MKPIAIFQFSTHVTPGYFSQYLQARGIPFLLIRVDQGASIPSEASAYSGIGLLGGEMGVNDNLPWIPPMLALIRAADQQRVPLIGHCLGGQLIAKALGAQVTRNAVKELGWGTLMVADNPTARAWVGSDAQDHSLATFTTFQWHGDTFSLPPDAAPLFSSAYCTNQGYVIERAHRNGQAIAHLGMQCHIEMTAGLVRTWAANGASEIAQEIARTGGIATQSSTAMLENLEGRTMALQKMATQLYDRWMLGVHAAMTSAETPTNKASAL